ncbi:MAG: potassium channel beta subunit family protein [Bdellovibrionota bacterium]
MLYRRLGKSGLKVSLFSFGSWVTFKNQVDVRAAREMMAYAYDQGVNFFDNAEVYANGESEKVMGEALRELAWGRDTFTVSSKVFWGGEKPTQRGLSRKHIFDACHAALKRLQVDYLDLFFCHRPDVETPVEETVLAMNDLIRQGKVLYWGTSEWDAQQITEAFAVARDYRLQGPTMEQPQYNLFERTKVERDFLPLYENYGLGTTIWSPLASGLLTGKYDKGVPADSRLARADMAWLRERMESEAGKKQLAAVRELAKVAGELEVPLATLSLAWCAQNPHVSTVILGASKIEQLKENLKALDVLAKITPALLERVDAIVGTKPVAVGRF